MSKIKKNSRVGQIVLSIWAKTELKYSNSIQFYVLFRDSRYHIFSYLSLIKEGKMGLKNDFLVKFTKI